MTHQDSTSPVLPRRSGRKVKPNRDPDYEYVQMRIDQLDRELAASGLSPRAPLITSHAHGSHDSPSSRQLSDPPVAVPSTSALTAEIELAQLQRDKLALELEVLKLRDAAAETKVEGVESKPSTTRKNYRLASRVLLRCAHFRIREVGDGRLCCWFSRHG